MDFSPEQIAQINTEEAEFKSNHDAWIKARAARHEAAGVDPTKAEKEATREFRAYSYFVGRTSALKVAP